MKHLLTEGEYNTLERRVTQAEEVRDLATKELEEWKDENVFKGTITEITNSPGCYSAFGSYPPTASDQPVAHYAHLKSFETAISGITKASDEKTTDLLNEGTKWRHENRDLKSKIALLDEVGGTWKKRAMFLGCTSAALAFSLIFVAVGAC
jgi:hypothetical protein